jgi:membrane associated rhomboid family serine protease
VFIPLHDANVLKHIRIQYVTLALIIANCLIWVIFGTGLVVSENAAKAAIVSLGYIPVVASGHENLPPELRLLPTWTSYFSYAFLHGDFMHLAGNMLFVWVFGDNVEDGLGHIKFALFYLLCAAAGAALHGWVHPQSQSPLIGASGAAAGIITAYVMLHPNVKVWVLALGRIPLRLSAFWLIGAWIAFQVFNFVVAGQDQVSWAAHVGGIAAGAVLLPMLKRRDVALFDRTPVDEVLPPVPPPAVAEKGHRLPGQTRTDTPLQSPWGRQGGSRGDG